MDLTINRMKAFKRIKQLGAGWHTCGPRYLCNRASRLSLSLSLSLYVCVYMCMSVRACGYLRPTSLDLPLPLSSTPHTTGAFGKAILVEKDGVRYVLKEVSLKGLPTLEKEGAEREAMILQKLSHPNIVRYVDSGLCKDTLWISMELVRTLVCIFIDS